jgi:hypothetical protein
MQICKYKCTQNYSRLGELYTISIHPACKTQCIAYKFPEGNSSGELRELINMGIMYASKMQMYQFPFCTNTFIFNWERRLAPVELNYTFNGVDSLVEFAG